MKTNRFFTIIIASLMIISCAPLKTPLKTPLRTPTIKKNENIEKFKYIFISPSSNLTSSSGRVYGGNYGVYGANTSKSVNSSEIITGILIKEGFIGLPELKPELADETLIVNYGESGTRDTGLGYTIEVTIQFISAKTYTQICSCTAEGQGATEADDIRQAITRCLYGLLSKEN
jgi:hypothetical protein